MPCANSPKQTPIAKKTARTFQVVIAPPPSYALRQNLPTSTSSPAVCETTTSLEEEYARNERRFYEESRRIQQEIHDKQEADKLVAEEEAKTERQQKAETDAKRRVFMYPYEMAKKMYDYHNRSSDKRVYTYWMDSHLDIYEYPANPYDKPPKVERERAFVWKSRMRTCKITHHDDPDTLEPGEWEYRDVMCWYKSYM